MSPIHDPEALDAVQTTQPSSSDVPPLPPELVREQLAHDPAPMQWSSDAI